MININCSNCGKQIPYDGNVCPWCHADKSSDKSSAERAVGIAMLVILAILVVAGVKSYIWDPSWIDNGNTTFVATPAHTERLASEASSTKIPNDTTAETKEEVLGREALIAEMSSSLNIPDFSIRQLSETEFQRFNNNWEAWQAEKRATAATKSAARSEPVKTDSTPLQFDENDLTRTQKWAVAKLVPFWLARKEKNPIAKADAVATQNVIFENEKKHLLGKKVRWPMKVSIHEKCVYIDAGFESTYVFFPQPYSQLGQFSVLVEGRLEVGSDITRNRAATLNQGDTHMVEGVLLDLQIRDNWLNVKLKSVRLAD